MLSTTIVTMDNIYVSYKTDVDNPMMAGEGVYKGAAQAYKNSKVHL